MNKKVLFISHDATLTGAPILLLNLLTCLRKAGYACNRIILKNYFGELVGSFSQHAELLFLNDKTNSDSTIMTNGIRKYLATKKEKINLRNIQNWIDEAEVIFSNTITNGDFLGKFNFAKDQKIISYIHELQIAAGFYTNENDRNIVLNKTDVFCVPSEAVRLFLQQEYQVDPVKIKRLNYYIPSKEAGQNKNSAHSNGKFIVGIIGTLDWRKGAELLPVIVLDFFNRYPDANLQFLWKGIIKSSVEFSRIEYELKKIGLFDRVLFEESSFEVVSFYTTIDVLLLCSKEDPYPLVVLEAASFKKPCICFKNAGGAAEFVQEDTGTIVPFLNIKALTESIFSYYSDTISCINKGNIAYKRYIEQHANELLIQEQFNQLIR